MIRKSGMSFKAKNGNVYTLCRDEYFNRLRCKTIFQTLQGWFYPENIQMWCYEIGEGSTVKNKDGQQLDIVHIFPNGTLEGGRSVHCSDGKSYSEFDLKIIAGKSRRQEFTEQMNKYKDLKNRIFKYLPDRYINPGSIEINSLGVSFTYYEGDCFGVVINNPLFIASYTSFFKELWEVTEK